MRPAVQRRLDPTIKMKQYDFRQTLELAVGWATRGITTIYRDPALWPACEVVIARLYQKTGRLLPVVLSSRALPTTSRWHQNRANYVRNELQSSILRRINRQACQTFQLLLDEEFNGLQGAQWAAILNKARISQAVVFHPVPRLPVRRSFEEFHDINRFRLRMYERDSIRIPSPIWEPMWELRDTYRSLERRAAIHNLLEGERSCVPAWGPSMVSSARRSAEMSCGVRSETA